MRFSNPHGMRQQRPIAQYRMAPRNNSGALHTQVLRRTVPVGPSNQMNSNIRYTPYPSANLANRRPLQSGTNSVNRSIMIRRDASGLH